MRNRLTVTLIAIGLLIALAGGADAQRLQVGDVIEGDFESLHPYQANLFARPQLISSLEIYDSGATYIAPHFSRMELAEGDYVIVRSPNRSRSWRYEGFGKLELGREGGGGFWGIHITGERAIVELFASGSRGAYGFSIDSYGRGFALPPDSQGVASELICAPDDKENAICYVASYPEIYLEAQAVARLFIKGLFACTGWLIGDEGHLMTNNHCIEDPEDAANTDFEFLAEALTCGEICPYLGCDGTIEADSSTFIQTSEDLDYTLVQLPTNLSGIYGFMQLRDTGAVLDELIWSAQHPGGRGKEFAILSTYPDNPSGFAEVDSLTEPVCQGGTDLEVGYWMDTEGGSSGSPVLGRADNLVIALHHCKGSNSCNNFDPGDDDTNRGVDVIPIIDDLGANLPNNAISTTTIFNDGFESGDTTAWTSTVSP